jgi:hypothetical protein
MCAEKSTIVTKKEARHRGRIYLSFMDTPHAALKRHSLLVLLLSITVAFSFELCTE